jgi:hypothetical protein
MSKISKILLDVALGIASVLIIIAMIAILMCGGI